MTTSQCEVRCLTFSVQEACRSAEERDQTRNSLMEGEVEPPSSVTILANDPAIEVGLEIECEFETQDSSENHEELNVLMMGYADRGTFGLKTWAVDFEAKDYVPFGDIYAAFHPMSMELMHLASNEDANRFIAVGFHNADLHVLKLNKDGSPASSVGLGSLQDDYTRHSDVIMDLSWNSNIKNVLASGSADNTVIVWDMNTCTAATRLECFSEKVQSVKWHPIEAQSLLTGCCDGIVKLFDCRTPGTNKSWVFEGEIERIMWNKFDPLHFFVSTGKGMVHYVDIRTSKPMWNLSAHTSAVGGLALSNYCKDILVTGSQDETAKVWILKEDGPALASKINVGYIYVISACPNSPFVFAAGTKNSVNPCSLFDIRDQGNVVKPFVERNEAQPQSDEISSSFDMRELAAVLP